MSSHLHKAVRRVLNQVPWLWNNLALVKVSKIAPKDVNTARTKSGVGR
jgi:hypothetical protein